MNKRLIGRNRADCFGCWSLQGQVGNGLEVTFGNKESPYPLSGAEICRALENNNCTLGRVAGEAVFSEAGRLQLRQGGKQKVFEKWLGIQGNLGFCMVDESNILMQGGCS